MVRLLSTAEIRERASRIRLVLSDVDGVLTDGGVYYSDGGEAMKRFSVRDGMGVERLRERGIETRFVTRERSPAVRARAEKLGVVLHEGVLDKRRELPAITSTAGAIPPSVAYIGDDVNDLGAIIAIAETGLTAAPADAFPGIKASVHFTTAALGGHGAFREFAEWLLFHQSTEGTE